MLLRSDLPIFPHHHKLNWLAKYRQEIGIKPQVNLKLNNINTLEECLFLFQMGRYCCIPTQPGDTFCQHKPSSTLKLSIQPQNSTNEWLLECKKKHTAPPLRVESLSPRLSTSIKPKFKLKTKAYRLVSLIVHLSNLVLLDTQVLSIPLPLPIWRVP